MMLHSRVGAITGAGWWVEGLAAAVDSDLATLSGSTFCLRQLEIRVRLGHSGFGWSGHELSPGPTQRDAESVKCGKGTDADDSDR